MPDEQKAVEPPAIDDAPEPEGAAGITLPPPPKKPANQFDRLKEHRRRLAAGREPLDVAIPGYNDELVARYRVLDYDELQKLRRRGGKMAQAQDPEAELKVTMDTIAAACVGMFVRQEDGSLLLMNECPSDLDLGDEPICYDERLAEVLGIELPTQSKVRSLIYQVFGEEDLLIFGHLERIDGWMSGINEDDDQDF